MNSADESKLSVLSDKGLAQLKDAVAQNKGTNVPECDNFIHMQSNIALRMSSPSLTPTAENDGINAIKVHEFLSNVTRTQALEERLWAYLAFNTFREYMLSRWSPALGSNTALDQHWLMGSQKPLSRHGIARLWWGAEITLAPWEQDSQYYGVLDDGDRYKYTKVLFRNPSLFTDIMERGGFCNSTRILIALLQYLSDHPEILNDRSANRELFKALTQELAFRKLEVLSFDALYSVLEELSTSLESRTE